MINYLKRGMRTVLATAFLLSGLFPAVAQASTNPVPVQDGAGETKLAASNRAPRVFVVMAPYLTWEDITPENTPTLYTLAEEGAVGDVNARSRTREEGEGASPLEGALTLSAGSWAVPVFSAAAAYSADEAYEYGIAGEAYERMTGEKLNGAEVAFLGLPVTQRENTERSSELTLGALGQAVEDAGGITFAIGNSDTGYVTGEQRHIRPAALVAMGEKGTVKYGEVSQELLKNDPSAPFGMRTDLAKFANELKRGQDILDEEVDPTLVVLDSGDLVRASRFAPQVTEKVANEQWEGALRTLDAVTSYVQENLGEDDVIIVTSQVSQDADGYEGFGPLIVYGGGYTGMLSSSSTHHEGVTTNLDVSATILKALDIKRPVSMLGNPVSTTQDDKSIDERIDSLIRYNKKAIAVESSKASTVKTYIVFSIVVLVLATILIVSTPKSSPRKTKLYFNIATGLLMGIAAFPLASHIMFILVPSPQSAAAATAALIASLVLIMGISIALWHFFSSRISFIFLMLATGGLLLVDQLVGTPLSQMGYLTYSPLLAARFYGIGNEGAALLFGSSLVGFALLIDMLPPAPNRTRSIIINVAFPLFALVASVVMAAPMFGANVAVIFWALVGYAAAWILFSGRKITWKSVLIALVAIVVSLVAFILYDLYGPGEITHLGRSILSAKEGGLRELAVIVARKVETSVRVLTFTNWSFMLIAVFVFLAIMKLRPTGDFAETLTENPALGHALTGSFIGGFAAMISEDSGIVIPALLFIYGGIAIVWAMLCHTRRKTGTYVNDGLVDNVKGTD